MNLATMELAMMNSISEVLEQMFFLPIEIQKFDELPKQDDPKQTHIMHTAGVDFAGPSSGTFLLSIPSDLAESMAADFMGTEPEALTSDQVTETVKEMINMLAGSALSAYDTESAFNLKIPQIFPNASLSATGKGPDASVSLNIVTPDSNMAFYLRSEEDQKTA